MNSRSQMKRDYIVFYTVVAVCILLLIPLPWLHGSSIATAAYSIVENSGSALTQRSVLDFTGAGISCVDDGTNKRTVCTVSGSSGTFGGVNVQTTNYTLQASDSGLLVVMNCSGACAATLNGSPTSSQTYAIVSIGSTLATVSLNSLDYNGTPSAPALTTGQILYFGSDGTNYFGNMPFTASSNVTFTPGSNNVAISASGGGGGAGTARGAFASATTCNGSFSGGVYYSTDVSEVGQCNGTSYQWFAFGRPLVPPSATSFTAQSCSTGCTVTYNGFGWMNIATNNTSPNLHGQYVSLPSTPFTVDACFFLDSINLNYSSAGIYVSDGTKWQAFEITQQNTTVENSTTTLVVSNYSNNTTYASNTISAVAENAMNSMMCARWHDDGTNVEVYTSLTGSNQTAYSSSDPNWTELGSFSRTTYLTPTQIGWIGDLEQTTRAATVTLTHWYVH